MAAFNSFTIEHLDLAAHREVTSSLEAFWLSGAKEVLPYHHPVIPLLFSDFSFVLRQNGQINAYLYGIFAEKRGFLHTVATRHGHYRQGCASALLEHWEEAASQRGLSSLWAYSVPGNTLSRRFLNKHGYISRKKLMVYSEVERELFEKLFS